MSTLGFALFTGDRMFGSHLSIAGSMVNALNEAQGLGLDTVQVFTKNQQQWRVPALDPGMAREFVAKTNELGWQGRLVSHASYLINLASVSDELWQKSVDLMTVEIERCAELGITYLVHHPGSHKDTTLEHGIERILDAYRELFKRTRGVAVVSCLEGTAGGGSTIGGRFEDLATLHAGVARATSMPDRVGVCLDTCHLHAAGHDMSTFEAADATLKRFDEVVGMQHLRVWHVNDSKGALGSKIDRHDHIGHGWVGGGLRATDGPNEDQGGQAALFGGEGSNAPKVRKKKAAAAKPIEVGRGEDPKSFDLMRLRASGFARVMADKRFASIPKIMETPKEELADGTAWDLENLRRLKALMAT